MTETRYQLIKGAPLNVKDFGATGNGVTDDTTAIQAAFTAASTGGDKVVFPEGTYIVSDNLFIYGDASIIGSGKGSVIKLNDLPSNIYWIVCGSAGWGGLSVPFTGVIEDITFDVPSSLANPINIALYLGSVDGAALRNVQVNSNGKCTNKAFGGINNNDAIVSPTRQRLLLENCVVNNAETTDGESFGFDDTERITLRNCSVFGESGDDMGLHGCTHGVIDGAYIEAETARIYVSDSSNTKITNSTIKYVHEDSGMGIIVECESIANDSVNTDITIANNTVIYTDTVTGPVATYGIRIQGARDVVVSGNRLINESSVACGNLYVEKQTLAGWEDPTELDDDDYPQPRTIVIDGNICDGKVHVTGGVDISIVNNVADHFYLTSAGGFHVYDNNNVTGDIADCTIDASAAIQRASKHLFTRVCLGANTTFVAGTEYNGAGSTEYLAQKDLAITHYVISTTTAVTVGFYQIDLYVDGVKLDDTNTFGTPWGKSVVQFINDSGDDYTVEAGSLIEVKAKCDNGTPSTNDVVIEVYGLEL